MERQREHGNKKEDIMLLVDWPMPPNCINCFMFNRTLNDCMICCHPPVDPYGKRPHWCPIKGEIDDERTDINL